MLKQYFTSIFLFLFVSFSAFAQNPGDYGVIANGDWDDPSTWGVWDGSSFVNDGTYPGQTAGTYDVYIHSGFTVTFNTNNDVLFSFNQLYIDGTLNVNNNTELRADQIIIRTGGILAWTSNVDLQIPSTGEIILDGGELGQDSPCNVNKTLSIGNSVFAACNDGNKGGADHTFQDINDAGGTECLTNSIDVSSNPVDQVVYLNGTVSFTVTSSDADTYQWQVSLDGGVTFTDIPSETSPTLTLSSVQLSSSGNVYRVQLFRGAYCNAFSNSATLTVIRRTVITNRNKTYRVNN